MVMKDDFLVYSIYPVFLIKRLVPGNVVMVATDMCGKNPHHGGVDILNYVNMCVLIFQFILLRYYFDYNNNVFLIGYCQYFGSHCYQCFHFLLLLIIILIYYSILITMFLSSLFAIFTINDTSNFIAFIVIANVVFNTSYRTVLSTN